MKILVTGAAGFIGSHLVELAERLGHEVWGIDALTYAGRSANLTPAQCQRIRQLDICDFDAVDAIVAGLRPDAIVHLAAESHVARSIESRDEFLRTNVEGTLVMLEAALAHWRAMGERPFRFVHVSTDEVYGSLGPAEPPWTEASPYAPNNPYAASKAASDHMVRAYFRTFGLPTIVTHSSNNYGPKQHPEKLIPTLIGQLRRGEPMTLHGDGLNVRDWLHVDDHCDGLMRALCFGHAGETYNFGGLCERTNLMIANLLHVVMAPTSLPNIELIGNRPGNDARYASDVTKAREQLGWNPGHQIGARLAPVVRWYLENPNYEHDYGR